MNIEVTICEYCESNLLERSQSHAQMVEYLQDLLTIKKMFGDHSYASHLEIFINKIKIKKQEPQ